MFINLNEKKVYKGEFDNCCFVCGKKFEEESMHLWRLDCNYQKGVFSNLIKCLGKDRLRICSDCFQGENEGLLEHKADQKLLKINLDIR